ncbi:CheY-like chemotaxis protein [Bradyrhizobium sp. S3.3.6]
MLRKPYLAKFGRCGSANLRWRIRRANHRLALPTHSMSAVYGRRIERTLNLAVDFRPVGSSRLRVPNVLWSQSIGLRPCWGEIVRNMQAKASLANLMRVAHTLDVVSVVTADRSVREALTDVVFSAGYVPEPFESADEFLKSGRRLITSCLIADMQSSVMSGLELFHHLVAFGGAIPTVLLTDHSEDDVRRVLQAGLQFLSKPFERSELLACVRSQIMNRNYSL